MSPRRFAFLAAVAAACLLPASAQAAPLTSLKVSACRAGDTPRDRQASFYAQVHAVPGTDHMSMRFTVYERTDAHTLQAEPSSSLQQWRRSRPGVRTYGYTQTVTGLQPGGDYVAGVDYRWLSASGAVLRTRHRLSTSCHEDGPLPNLTIPGLSARLGSSAGTEVYAVQVTNQGAAPARDVDVDIFVDSAQADTAHVDEIAPGETAVVHITGPACAQQVRAVVDRLGRVNETTHGDNVFRSGCPAPAG